MRQLFITAIAFTTMLCSCTNATVESKKANPDNPRDTTATTHPQANDDFITGKGEFYCQGNIAADGLGCVVKIDGVEYKMQKDSTQLFEESAWYDKAGKPVPVVLEYKKTGQRFRMMGGHDGPELILIRSIKPVE
jgi:hypothetical protein